MSIWSDFDPKFVVGATTLNLDNANLIVDDTVPDQVTHESPLGHYRVLVNRGDHYRYVVDVNIHAYADENAAIKAIYAQLGQEGDLYHNRSASAFSDANGDPVAFVFLEAHQSYLNDNTYPDVLRCKFISTKYVDLLQSV